MALEVWDLDQFIVYSWGLPIALSRLFLSRAVTHEAASEVLSFPRVSWRRFFNSARMFPRHQGNGAFRALLGF